MALKKELIDNKGIKTLYHRISDFVVNKDKNIIEINVKSYADEKYRQEEKEYEDFIKTREEKMEKLDELVLKNADGSKTDEVKKLTEEINNMYNTKVVEQNTYIFNKKIELDFDINQKYSLEDIYNRIKSEIPDFANSTDV